MDKIVYLSHCEKKIDKKRRMKIIAHRGASYTCPENTLAAFQRVALLPVDGVELDVHVTKDRQLVVIHDEKINRTSNGKGYIKDMTLAELRRYDYGNWFHRAFAGQHIPTLQEVLKIFAHTHHQVHIELKTNIVPYEGIEQLVVQEVIAYNMGNRVIISSFDHEAIQRVIKLEPKIEVAALFSNLLVDYCTYASCIPVRTLHVSKYIATRKPIQQAILVGYLVRVYTVNNVQQAKYLEKLGVDAIFTDEPEKFLHFK